MKQGIEQEDLAHGVVVQTLIDAEKSGILFTANPVNGRRDQMLLNASWGLGEAIVGGAVTPDQWVMDKKSREMLEKNMAQKELMTIRSSQGIEFVKVPSHLQERITLTDNEVQDLFALGRQVEDYFDSPQDIEWTFFENTFYLVQSRPITSLFPLPKPRETGPGLRIYMNFTLYSQAMNEPLTPIGRDIIAEMFLGMLELSYRGFDRQKALWYKEAAGRIFMDITGFLGFRIISEKMKGADKNDKDPVTTKALLQVYERNKGAVIEQKGSGLKIALNLLWRGKPWALKVGILSLYQFLYGSVRPKKARLKAMAYGEALLKEVEDAREGLRSTEERLRFMEKRVASLFKLFGVVFYVSISSTYIEKARAIMEKHLEDTEEISRVEKSVPHSVTTEMGMELLKIAAELHEEGVTPDLHHPAIQKFLARYGHRSNLEIDLGIPRWKEDPQYILHLLHSYMEHQTYKKGLEMFYQGERGAQEAIRSIVGQLEAKGAKRDGKKVARLLTHFRNMFGVRELPKYYLTAVFRIMREVMLEVGEELVREGRLHKAADVFFVRFADIRSGQNLKERVEENREEYQREFHRRAPRVMTSTGESIYFAVEEEGENTWMGIPVSPGIYEGVVRVLEHPDEGSSLQQGDVLVTKGTNPAWTPLFLRIGTLVMETGGPISHGSVVAREYGLPAVAGFKNATERLKDGTRVRVNGETGSVELIEEYDG